MYIHALLKDVCYIIIIHLCLASACITDKGS